MRKLWALLLAAVLIAGLCLPASALEFTDGDTVRNAGALELMAALGLIHGYEDGSFRPESNIRRSEAAKLVSLICEPLPAAAGTADFADVAQNHWAAGYIAYCARNSIVSGYEGKFYPENYVTGREFAKMLMACLGYDGSRYTGTGWAAAVDEDARALGIYHDFEADPARFLTRDDACLLMYNAMQCYAVTKMTSVGPIYALDALMNPLTYMEYRFGVVKFSGILEANEYADLREIGGRLESGKTKLEGHAAFDVSTPYEYLGREVEVYATRSTIANVTSYTVLGTPFPADGEQAFSGVSETVYRMALDQAGLSTAAATEYYLNGDWAGAEIMDRLTEDCTITAVDRDGDNVLDVILVTRHRECQVVSLTPFTVSLNGDIMPAEFMDEPWDLQKGSVVRCAVMGGVCRVP